MPRVYNKHARNAPVGAVYIGRGSLWGNPFVIGRDGTRDEVCNKYAAMVEADPALKARVTTALQGKDLVCFCHPARCHGDYLLAVANGNSERRAPLEHASGRDPRLPF
jgi:hypothetical protein